MDQALEEAREKKMAVKMEELRIKDNIYKFKQLR